MLPDESLEGSKYPSEMISSMCYRPGWHSEMSSNARELVIKTKSWVTHGLQWPWRCC
jgi:hypothetical protein